MSREDARINFTLPPELKDDLLTIAAAHNRNLTQELTVIISEYVRKEKVRAGCVPVLDAEAQLAALIAELKKKGVLTPDFLA